jgi:hypothetical protein
MKVARAALFLLVRAGRVRMCAQIVSKSDMTLDVRLETLSPGGLDSTLEISGFTKLKLAKCASISGLPEIDHVVRKSGKTNPTAAGSLRRFFSTIEIQLLSFRPDNKASSCNAVAAWLRYLRVGGPMLAACIFNRAALRSHAFLSGQSRNTSFD